MVERVDTIAILERAHSLANEAMFTVALQCRRIKTVEPEDETFIFRWWVDFQFLILALCRLRRAVKIAHKVPAITGDVKVALHKFDRALPHLIRLRNVGEHIDEYVVDSESRHDKTVEHKGLQVGNWNGTIYEWLDIQLNVHDALVAAEELYGVLQSASKELSTKGVNASSTPDGNV